MITTYSYNLISCVNFVVSIFIFSISQNIERNGEDGGGGDYEMDGGSWVYVVRL